LLPLAIPVQVIVAVPDSFWPLTTVITGAAEGVPTVVADVDAAELVPTAFVAVTEIEYEVLTDSPVETVHFVAVAGDGIQVAPVTVNPVISLPPSSAGEFHETSSVGRLDANPGVTARLRGTLGLFNVDAKDDADHADATVAESDWTCISYSVLSSNPVIVRFSAVNVSGEDLVHVPAVAATRYWIL